MKNLIFISFLVNLLNLKLFETTPIVKTSYGLVQGVEDAYAYLYLGIPYAKPPVNNLRWENPIQNDPWYPSILNASSFKPACPQSDCSSHMPKESCPDSVWILFLYLTPYLI